MYESVRKSRIYGSSNSEKTNTRDNVLPNKVNSRYRFQPIYDNPDSFLSKKRIREEDLDGSKKVELEDVSLYFGLKPSEEDVRESEMKKLQEQVNASTMSTEKVIESTIQDILLKLEAASD